MMIGMLVRGELYIPRYHAMMLKMAQVPPVGISTPSAAPKAVEQPRPGRGWQKNEHSTLVEFHFGSSFLGCVEDPFYRNLSVFQLIFFHHSGNE